MQRKNPDVDIIKEVLLASLEAMPASAFLRSLLHQYEERGGLSKKQLQGLLGKASKLRKIPPARLATLEAVILKKPGRYKSALPPVKPMFVKDEATGAMIEAILARYPGHKPVLLFKSKYDRDEQLSPAELSDLARFHKLLVK